MLTAMWIRTNSNPRGREVDDCVVRALAEATGRSWRAVYLALAVSGCEDGNMPDANDVWGGYLRSLGWIRGAIDGATIPASIMTVPGAVVEQYYNVSRAINADVWRGCCETVTVRNVSDQPILVQHANIIFSRPDLAVTR